MDQPARIPPKAWVVTFAGTAVNLCLGVLYGWSVWKAKLITDADHPAGSPMSGLDEGWSYLTDAQATWAYAICGFVFALFMIPGGRLQDKFGPKLGATLGGLCLAGGCILAGVMKSYTGLILGFGILGGIGMGLGMRRSRRRQLDGSDLTSAVSSSVSLSVVMVGRPSISLRSPSGSSPLTDFPAASWVWAASSPWS